MFEVFSASSLANGGLGCTPGLLADVKAVVVGKFEGVAVDCWVVCVQLGSNRMGSVAGVCGGADEDGRGWRRGSCENG